MKIIEVRNPRNGLVDYHINPPTPEQLTETCLYLRTHQSSWENLSVYNRIDVLQSWKKELIEAKNEIIDCLVNDTGRMNETVLEFNSIISIIDRWCKLAPILLKPEERKTSSIPFLNIEGQFVPYQLVGVISPWNFPLLLSLIDAIPALLAGSAVVIKPSEFTPRFIQPLMKSISKVEYLKSVLQIVEGTGSIGEEIINQVDLVAFTGSVATGRKVGEACAKRFIPAFLELGGKDPAIVLETADLDKATSAILWGSVANAGQSCLSIERVYVDNKIINDFVRILLEKVKKIKFAYPTPNDGQIGPIITRKQTSNIKTQLLDAIAKGAVIHSGGEIEEISGGEWCFPTVLTKVNHQMKVMVEETFGPLIPVMGFNDIKEAILLANDSNFGLGGAVFAGSEKEALTVASRLEAGAISINDAALTAVMYEGEKNSFKFSGIGGSRMGPASIQRFIRKKSFLINTGASDPWWY